MKKKLWSLLAVSGLVLMSSASFASEGVEIPERHWSHHGVTGTYDRAQLQRGFQIYKEVCSACHSLKLLSYRDLAGLGYNADEIKAIAAEYTVTDGPNDDGEMFERPARPSDRFKSPFANDKAARAANGGALPPDMSLIVKSRAHGEDYLVALLTGYGPAPADVTLNPGMYYNKYFPGHQISMAPPLADGQVTFADGAPNTIETQAQDIAAFLAWAAEPHMEERKRIGLKIVLFMLVFAGVMFGVKRKMWKDVH